MTEQINQDQTLQPAQARFIPLRRDGAPVNAAELVAPDARVLSINISETKGVVKTPVAEGEFLEEMGLKGDAHAGAWHRMVSLLAIESYAAMAEKGSGELAIGSFAENLTTQGVVLHRLPVGTRLAIGPTRMEITQIGKECHTGCAIRQLVGDCVMPREGVFAKILKGGIIHPGDAIRLITTDEADQG